MNERSPLTADSLFETRFVLLSDFQNTANHFPLPMEFFTSGEVRLTFAVCDAFFSTLCAMSASLS
jgi:hypothetical protein